MSPSYGSDHQALRRALLPGAYGRPCPFCGKPMLRGQTLDLDHRHGAMSHSGCNRRDGAQVTNKARAAALRAVRNGRVEMTVKECALAVAVSEDRHHTSLVTASWVFEQEFPVVELRRYLDGTATLVAEVRRLLAELPVLCTVIDPRSQAATAIKPLRDAGVTVTEPSYGDLVVANGTYRDEFEARRLLHVDEPRLEAALRAAELRPLAGAHTWDRRGDADASPLLGATLALWALFNAPSSEPQIFFG